MDIEQVLEHLPHRYPFLLIDRVIECIPGERLVGLKNVSYNEPYFLGHFPQKPVMPGVLILEALAQATGILAFKTAEQTPSPDSIYYLVGIDDARFKSVVSPGDQLILEVTYKKSMRDIWKFDAVARVGDKVAATASIMSARR